MVQSALNSLPYPQSNSASDIMLAKAGFGVALGYDNSYPKLLAQAFKPVPAVAPLPVVKPSVKGRWIVDEKSGKKVLVSNLPDGRVRIEVAKNKAYFEIATSDSFIRQTLADPTSALARHATYRVGASDEMQAKKEGKGVKKQTKQAGSEGKSSGVTIKNADTYNVDRSYIPPNMLPEDSFIGYAGVDIFDKKKSGFVRHEVLVGVSKKGRGFYIVDRKGKKTTFPNATTDREAMEMGRMWVRSKLENPASTDILPMVSGWAVNKPVVVAAIKKPERSPFDNLRPDIWLVGAGVVPPPNPFLKSASLWCQFPYNGNPPIIFGSINPAVIPSGRAPFGVDGINKLAAGIAYTYNTLNGKWEAGLGGSMKIPLPLGNNAVVWLNARSESDSPIPRNVYPQIPKTGKYTIAVNAGCAIGLLEPLAITSMGVATLAGMLGAAAPITAPVTGPVTAGGVAVAKGAEIVSKAIGGDGYLGLGWRLELRYLDGKLQGLFKDGNKIELKDLVDYVQKKINILKNKSKRVN